MPRSRAKLTDKQEKILLQCQLMGLTTRDMTQISNRLQALDREREFKSKVSDATAGFMWKEKTKTDFVVTDSDGKIYEVKTFSEYTKPNNFYYGRAQYANITISKPGTRFKIREIKAHKLSSHLEDEIIASVCPEGNKNLYRVMRDIKKGRIA